MPDKANIACDFTTGKDYTALSLRKGEKVIGIIYGEAATYVHDLLTHITELEEIRSSNWCGKLSKCFKEIEHILDNIQPDIKQKLRRLVCLCDQTVDRALYRYERTTFILERDNKELLSDLEAMQADYEELEKIKEVKKKDKNMSFRYEKLPDGNYEVIMQAYTLPGNSSTKERRFAYCTHENDAEVIVQALNIAEHEARKESISDIYEAWSQLCSRG